MCPHLCPHMCPHPTWGQPSQAAVSPWCAPAGPVLGMGWVHSFRVLSKKGGWLGVSCRPVKRVQFATARAQREPVVCSSDRATHQQAPAFLFFYPRHILKNNCTLHRHQSCRAPLQKPCIACSSDCCESHNFHSKFLTFPCSRRVLGSSSQQLLLRGTAAAQQFPSAFPPSNAWTHKAWAGTS